MKVTSFTTLPRVGDAIQHRMVFAQDDMAVTKTLHISRAMQKVASARPYELGAQMVKAICEAERDFAFRMFGDEWFKHVGRRGCQAHVDIACDAAAMRPDLFPGFPGGTAEQQSC